MATINQVKTGVVRYIDNDMLPHLTGAKKVALGVYTALAAENAAKIAVQFAKHPAVSVLAVIDENGNVDIDRLYRSAAPMFSNGQRVLLHIPVIGDYTVDNTDVEKLYRYIKEAQG